MREGANPAPPDTVFDTGPRFLLYSHDGVGLGHVRRNLALASALVAQNPRAAVLIVAGIDDLHGLGVPPGVEVLNLPGLRKLPDGHYWPRRLRVGFEGLRCLRTGLLAAAVEAFRPTALLADKHPLGIDGELLPALQALRAAGGRAVLGLRDVLDDPASVRREWQSQHLAEQVIEHYDRVLVYGQPEVLDPVAEYGLSDAVTARLRYCGYVVRPPGGQVHDEERGDLVRRRPTVLATAGGGEDGLELLRAFVAASAGAPWHGVVVTGPMAPEGPRSKLEAEAAAAGVVVRRFVRDLDGLFGHVDALVTMGGYNTLAEALVRGTPAVCVPRIRPRTEQYIRSTRFSRLGLLTHIEPHELAAETLRPAVSDALASSRHACHRRAHGVLRFDGARQAAGQLLDLAGPQPGGASLEAVAQ